MKHVGLATIAALVLTGCGSGDNSAATPEACAQQFVDTMEVWPGQPGTVASLNYLFDVSAENIDLVKNGLEGIRPDISATTGSGAERLAEEQAVLALRKDERPRLVYFAQKQPRLVYAPERAFSRDEARAHILEMCRLRDRGGVLRQVHVFVKAGSS
jgi:hypothetical protein